MAQERKCILIVDDTDIDRMMLRGCLGTEFDILEADGGNAAFQYITTKRKQIDAILLDISMPHIDGFDVLRFMADKHINNIPVFLVTAEPTKENVEKAMQYKIAGFISKPINREDVQHRLRSRLGIVPEYNLSNDEVKATMLYITRLKDLYKRCLANLGRTDESCQNVSDLVHIMLTDLIKTTKDFQINDDANKIISQAAYFCDIGKIFLPSDRSIVSQAMYQEHTTLGANLIRLNSSPQCKYFVEICSSMCMHHHERYDGEGYPHGLAGQNNSIFNQICRIADEFENIRSKLGEDKAVPVKAIIRHIMNNDGIASSLVCSLLEDCEQQIVDYFLKKGT